MSESPKKLQRFIHNQLLSPPSTSELSFSRTNLLPAHPFLSAIVARCHHLHSVLITSLDCHFCIVNKDSISILCRCLVNLEELKVVDCQLDELNPNTTWPGRLRCLDFSRNKLTECPQGLDSLLYLTTLNLSGNLISQLDPTILRLPLLEKFYFIQNPILNIPKHICRAGVTTMREYFKTEILPLPPQRPDLPSTSSSLSVSRKSSSSMCELERCHDLRRYLLCQQSSFDSGYESSQRCRTTSGSSVDTTNSDNSTESTQWATFEPFHLPDGYTPAARTDLCQVYLPEGCEDQVNIELVKDLSLYPKVDANELLITPVVQITPHGRRFSSEQPAILVLPHCTKPEDGGCGSKQELIPVYSGSGLHQPTAWDKLDGECCCEIFKHHVVFKTTHFSLFAVVSRLPYPSASISIGPNYGGSLTIPDVPGLQVILPPTLTEETTVTSTVYYDDPPYNIESAEQALASPCIGLEPHGTQFVSPVEVTLPIPNYAQVMRHYPNAKLELWHAPGPLPSGPGMDTSHHENWEQFNSSLSIEVRDGQHVLVFHTDHFSWWETLWDIGRRALQRVGLGTSLFSSRRRYISVRIQALMSPPLTSGRMESPTFGLLVAVYKFGLPLSHLSNYPLSLLDTGTKKIYLQLGALEVRVHALQECFSAVMDLEDSLTQSTELVDFNGDDFCRRFEYALQLSPGYELKEGMLLGKLYLKQWDGSTPNQQHHNLIVEKTSSTRQPSTLSQDTPLTPVHQPLFNNPDFTPPWSPESDSQMETEEVFLREPSASVAGLHYAVHTLPRKRPLNPVNASGHPDHPIKAKRRLLCRQGDIDEKTLLKIANAVGSKYTELGLQLGLNYNWIQSNVENKANMTKDNLKALCVLHGWRARAGEEFTYSELARALEVEEVGLRSVACQVCYATS